MEHAELISKAFGDVKKALFGFSNFPTWIKLFLLLLVPAILGGVAATIILQLIVKPILVSFFVNDNYGFTEAGISHILQFCAVVFAFLCLFIVPLFQGFLYRLIRSDSFPTIGNGFGLFFSGWRVNIVCLFYAIPMIIIYAIFACLYFFAAGKVSGITTLVVGGASIGNIVIFFIYLALQFVTFIAVALFAIISLVHVARGASYKDAFRFRNTAKIIKEIGWYNYILCVVICAIFVLILTVIFLGIAVGFTGNLVGSAIVVMIYLFLLIPIAIFCCRYLTQVHDLGTAPKEEDLEEFDDF
ncbi:MAG TPA: DUF4013 domain-containing protein [Methanocorpusculum sp.]|nr:DUF4013 domain-containing protein [Methanocorpusculum sp.]